MKKVLIGVGVLSLAVYGAAVFGIATLVTHYFDETAPVIATVAPEPEDDTYWVNVPSCEDAQGVFACVYFDEGVMSFYPRGEGAFAETLTVDDYRFSDSGVIEVNLGDLFERVGP